MEHRTGGLRHKANFASLINQGLPSKMFHCLMISALTGVRVALPSLHYTPKVIHNAETISGIDQTQFDCQSCISLLNGDGSQVRSRVPAYASLPAGSLANMAAYVNRNIGDLNSGRTIIFQ